MKYHRVDNNIFAKRPKKLKLTNIIDMRFIALSIAFFAISCFTKVMAQTVNFQDLSANPSYSYNYDVSSDGTIISGQLGYIDSSTGLSFSFGSEVFSITGNDFSTAMFKIYVNGNFTPFLLDSYAGNGDKIVPATIMTDVNDTYIDDTKIINSQNKEFLLDVKRNENGQSTDTGDFLPQVGMTATARYIGFRYNDANNKKYYGWMELLLDYNGSVGYTIKLMKVVISDQFIQVGETGVDEITDFDVSITGIYKDSENGNLKFTIPFKTQGVYTLAIEKIPANTPDTYSVNVLDNTVLNFDINRGSITTLKEGETNIELTAIGGYTQTIKVVVGDVEATGLSIGTENGAPLEINVSKGNLQLRALTTPLSATNQTFRWYSDDQNTQIDADLNPSTGLLTVNEGNGVLRVFASYQNSVGRTLVGSADVTISNQSALSVRITKIDIILPNTIVNDEIIVGTDAQLSVNITPANATIQAYRYVSLTSMVCTVDSDTGLITTSEPGICRVRVEALDASNVTALTPSITVRRNVQAGEVESFSWSPTQGAIQAGETIGVRVDFEPVNPTNKDLIWTSSNESVVEVSQENNIDEVAITAKTPGSAIVTASSVAQGSNTIAVVNRIFVNTPAQGFTMATDFAISPNIRTVLVGAKINFTPMFTPVQASNQNVVWTSSDPTILSLVQSSPTTIGSDRPREAIGTANSAGSVSITAVTLDGSNVTRSIILIVQQGTVIPVQSIELSYPLGEGRDKIIPGDILTPTLEVLPANASNKTVLFTSSDPGVAIVNSMGQLTALKNGSTFISAFVTDGSTDNAMVRLRKTVSITVALSFGLNQITSINESSEKQMAVYPNPIDDNEFYIDAPVEYYPMDLSLRQLTGEIVYETQIINPSPLNQVTLRKHLTSGIYLLEVKKNDEIIQVIRLQKE